MCIWRCTVSTLVRTDSIYRIHETRALQYCMVFAPRVFPEHWPPSPPAMKNVPTTDCQSWWAIPVCFFGLQANTIHKNLIDYQNYTISREKIWITFVKCFPAQDVWYFNPDHITHVYICRYHTWVQHLAMTHIYNHLESRFENLSVYLCCTRVCTGHFNLTSTRLLLGVTIPVGEGDEYLRWWCMTAYVVLQVRPIRK